MVRVVLNGKGYANNAANKVCEAFLLLKNNSNKKCGLRAKRLANLCCKVFFAFFYFAVPQILLGIDVIPSSPLFIQHALSVLCIVGSILDTIQCDALELETIIILHACYCVQIHHVYCCSKVCMY